MTHVTLHSLRCEYQTNPVGIDVARPRLSWQLASERRGVQQTSYRILVADSLATLNQNIGNLWDSKRVTTHAAHLRQYRGLPLSSQQRVYWKVIVWDEKDRRSAWSEPAFWEMGLLEPAERPSGWVTPDFAKHFECSQPLINQLWQAAVPHLYQETAFGGNAVVVRPWMLYQQYGDKRVLAENYGAMQRWVAYLHEQAGEAFIWSGDKDFEDWLAMAGGDGNGRYALTDTDLIATAYYAHSAGLLAKIARVLKREEEAQVYEQLATAVAQAFCAEFVTANGRIAANTPTGCVLPLMFDLLPEEQRPEAARRLVANIRSRDNHLATGFLGTPYLCHVLTRFGYVDVAYDLLLSEKLPAANHAAYGAIGDWLVSTVAGLQLDEPRPGYKHTLIYPRFGGDLTFAQAELETVNGRLAAHWQITDEAFTLRVTIPANTTATIILPLPSAHELLEGERPIREAPGIKNVQIIEGSTLIDVGSGSYEFMVKFAD